MLKYKQDKKSIDILGYELRNKVSELRSFSFEYVLDLGGNNGKLVTSLKTKSNKLISIDIDRSIMYGYDGKPLKEIEPIQGNILHLPFKDNVFDFIFARAILHHVPNKLDLSFQEIKRVLKPSGILLIEEPSYHNPVAYVMRKSFPTTSHEEGEQPLKVKTLKCLSNKYFTVLETKYYWLFSYTLPHLISRLPSFIKPNTRVLLKGIVKVDKILLNINLLKPFCGYVMILCQK